MEDRFKFRFWFKDTQEMIYSEKFNDVQTLGQWLFEDRKDMVKMQCTGIKDKNCKLIYENDIVKFYFDNDEIIAVLIWDNDESRFYLNTTDYFKDKYVTDYEITKQEKYEVIGNIYLDSHLLEN